MQTRYLRRDLRGSRVRAALLGLLLAGCATVRPDYYTPDDCQRLRREARRAGAVQTGAQYVAAGLAAGGAVAEAVADSKAATISLAIGAVVAGALGLGAGSYADDAAEEVGIACTPVLIPLPVLPGSQDGFAFH